MQLSKAEIDLLFEIARESIRGSDKFIEQFSSQIPNEGALILPAAVFVTLFNSGELRGCIGQTTARFPLWEAVGHIAHKAATQDSRFPPVQLSELPDLQMEISILSDPVLVESPDDIQIGRDGLIIEAKDRRGLLLPQVAEERGWDVTTFLGQTCRKAGLPPDAWKEEPGVVIQRFEAIRFKEESP